MATWTEQSKNSTSWSGTNSSSSSWSSPSKTTSLQGKILLEDGDDLLQEDSSFLLQENYSSSGASWTSLTKN